MATKHNPNKEALKKNRLEIIDGLANPKSVVDYLFTVGLFDEDMKEDVMQIKPTRDQTRKMLDILGYRGKTAAKGLSDAFLNTSNKELAVLLAPYIETIQSEDNKMNPKKWPPTDKDQKTMEADPVKKITDLNSPRYIHKYTSTEVYKMRNRIRGKVFMINNEKFEKKTKMSDRIGSNVDAENLESLFKQLHFEVVTAKDQSAKDMIDFLTKERDKVNWYEMECVVLIFMSHGETGGIYGTNGKPAKLKDMTDIFDSSQCPGLNEKPRLVFVQANRGSNTERASTGCDNLGTYEAYKKYPVDPMKCTTLADKSGQDMYNVVPSKETEVTERNVHSAADFLIAYASSEGSVAYRNIESGSWFLNAIVWTFKYHAHEKDILHLLSRVAYLVSQGRTTRGDMAVPEINSSLRKRFFFFPGVYDNPPKLVSS